jgi:hypothetical protein
VQGEKEAREGLGRALKGERQAREELAAATRALRGERDAISAELSARSPRREVVGDADSARLAEARREAEILVGLCKGLQVAAAVSFKIPNPPPQDPGPSIVLDPRNHSFLSREISGIPDNFAAH